MKKKAAFALVLLAACGGNYSNQDVEFIGALPVRRELESKLPQQPQRSTVTNTRQDALTVGDDSPAYRDARAASDAFNGALFWLLDLIDQIRVLPPSRREPDRRIWGPFPDHDQPDFLVEVVLERQDHVLFNYRIEVRRKDAPSSAPWTPFVVGSFRATGGARKGTGEVHLLAATVRESGFSTGSDLEKVQTIDMGYVTDQWPIQVAVFFQGMPNAGFDTVGYAYNEFEDRHGSIQFIAKGRDRSGNEQLLAEVARWLPSGQGRADIAVRSGSFFGAQAVECWDAQFRVTYSNRPWESPSVVGDPASCAL